MIEIKGTGWISGGRYGAIRSGERSRCEEVDPSGRFTCKSLFAYPFKNFGRLDDVSRNVCHAVALAMRDAGVSYSMGFKQDIGIIGTNATGSIATDVAYFRDYLEGGRTLGRASLFIYTLTSSPLGEAAIHFGLLGPLLYASSTTGALASLVAMAGEMIESGEAGAMLVGEADEREAIYMLIGRGDAPLDIDQELSKIYSEVHQK